MRPSAATQKLIGELGLRYRPSAQADLEAHAAALSLMTKDLAFVPANLLERAIGEWAQTSKFLPKASELIELAKGYLAKPSAPADPDKALAATAARLNAAMTARTDGRRDIQWIVEGGDLRLEHLHQSQPRFTRPITAPIAEIEVYAKKQQASKKATKALKVNH